MVNITIDPQLKEVWQQAALGCVQCRVVVQPSSRQLSCHQAQNDACLSDTIPARFKRISNHDAVQPQIRDPQQDTHYIAYHSIALI